MGTRVTPTAYRSKLLPLFLVGQAHAMPNIENKQDPKTTKQKSPGLILDNIQAMTSMTGAGTQPQRRGAVPAPRVSSRQGRFRRPLYVSPLNLNQNNPL